MGQLNERTNDQSSFNVENIDTDLKVTLRCPLCTAEEFPRVNTHMRYVSDRRYSIRWLMPTCSWSAMGVTHSLPSNLNTDLLPVKSRLPNSGGNMVSLFPWMWSSLNLVSSPISFGKSIRSFSRSTSYNLNVNKNAPSPGVRTHNL